MMSYGKMNKLCTVISLHIKCEKQQGPNFFKMVIFSKPITDNKPQGNCPQELKPTIPLERPEP
eukprot:8595679-Ditylum_brightwellii.AAC.1